MPKLLKTAIISFIVVLFSYKGMYTLIGVGILPLFVVSFISVSLLSSKTVTGYMKAHLGKPIVKTAAVTPTQESEKQKVKAAATQEPAKATEPIAEIISEIETAIKEEEAITDDVLDEELPAFED